MKINIPLIGAIVSAIASTLCCLPAFLFLFFGISSGFLSYFTTIDYLRFPMGIIAILFFLYAFQTRYKKISCACTTKEKIKNSIFPFIIFVGIIFLLFYPEILPLIMEF